MVIMTALPQVISAVPIEDTPYGRSGLRLEIRPSPKGMLAHGKFEDIEGAHAKAGISARWISVMTPLGSPEYESAFIPTDVKEAAENEALFKEWIRALHANHLPVVSWYPLIITQSGVVSHPEWRQKFLGTETEGHTKGIAVCFHTGYGEALINFCNEAIDRFGLDGLWFDGAAWTQIWDRPIPLSCVCDDCRKQFKQDTGLDLPSEVAWSSPTFRRWVAWRYEAFGRYIGRIAKGIRSKHPNAAVIINHYHRPVIPWQGAIPLNPYNADIISGSEATGQERVDVTMRLCRAYGRKQSEVWRPFTVGGDKETDDLVHHALACITTGGMPSFGGDVLTSPQAVETVRAVAEVVNALRPYVTGESLKDAALHLSQQTETFHFSRAPKGVGWDLEPYWASIERWTDHFGRAHRSPDYVYDRSLTPQGLTGYRVLLMPMSQALSEAQARAVVDFVRNGGTVLLGPGAGQLDEWGEPRHENPLGRAFGFDFEGVPGPDADELSDSTLVPVDGGDSIRLVSLETPIRLKDRSWTVRFRRGSASDAPPAIATRPYGKGHVILSSTEQGVMPAGWEAVFGGDTRIAVTDEKVRQGRHALKLVDGPQADHSFYPDMEMRFASFGLPKFPEGRFACDLWLGPASSVSVELRQHLGEVTAGPSLSFAKGKVSIHDRELGDIPMEQWIRVEITVHFAKSTGANFDLALETEKGLRQRFDALPCVNGNFSGCNWAVLYGAGQEKATFYVDNLSLDRADRNGNHYTVLSDDFESTPLGGVKAVPSVPPLARVFTQIINQFSSPLIEVEAPDSVRVGAFRQGGKVVLHLHNLSATHKDWKQPTGPSVTLKVRLPVKRAWLPLSGESLSLRKGKVRTIINVPNIGLHQVVVLES